MSRRRGLVLPPQIVRPDAHWCSLAELIEVFGVSKRSLQRWCADGTFQEFGYEVRCDNGGVWWVNMPPEKLNTLLHQK